MPHTSTSTSRLYDMEGSIVIRHATDADGRLLADLAALDSARPLSGPALVAVVDGEPRAAIALADRRVVADPFRRTAQAAELLRVRADHLESSSPSARAPRRALRLRRAAA